MVVGMVDNITIENSTMAIVAIMVTIMAKISTEAIPTQEAATIIVSKEMSNVQGEGHDKWSVTGAMS